MNEVQIKTVPRQSAVGLTHRGAYTEIGRTFAALGPLLGKRGLGGPGSHLVAVYFDDPAKAPEDRLLAFAGVIVPAGVAFDPPLVAQSFGGGRHAVLRHNGPYDTLPEDYVWLASTWLPGSGERAAAAPMFEIYLNTMADAAPADLRTDIYLPLEPKGT